VTSDGEYVIVAAVVPFFSLEADRPNPNLADHGGEEATLPLFCHNFELLLQTI
jgi:hypothetical protein